MIININLHLTTYRSRKFILEEYFLQANPLILRIIVIHLYFIHILPSMLLLHGYIYTHTHKFYRYCQQFRLHSVGR